MFSIWQLFEMNFLKDNALKEAKTKIGHINKKEIQPENLIDISVKNGDVIGILEVPALEKEIPILHGVDEEELKIGVGHFPGTAFPGQKNQIVLSGHRDTVFRKFGELKIGDSFIVKMPYGEYEYIIDHTKIVSADDQTIIVPNDGQEVLTVTTCYPFQYIGNAPDRYIIYALPKK
ncbi:class D sortase [Lederbergia wuyishanensis]|uniref:Sortase A n=1 Tax=Lederbergia wuyishanensis TaxID=1347903 RepID=A0ABU0DAT7_9BACI|nr:class D sortase [Lederbergia wuyishanensis]MCJ8009649.1 class D sortase [Lederbergia wuyishanensis]MDQ0345477.1 sortase A [Lederbergia wuyishanensis]